MKNKFFLWFIYSVVWLFSSFTLSFSNPDLAFTLVIFGGIIYLFIGSILFMLDI
jgi:hypothetical protein